MIVKVKGKWLAFVFVLSMVIIVAGCSEGNGSNQQTDAENTSPQDVPAEDTHGEETELEPEEMTLTVLFQYADFEENIQPFVEAQFPHITLEHIRESPENIEEIIAFGELPDLFYIGSPAWLQYLQEVEMARDLTDLIDRHNYDLNIFRPETVQIIRNFSSSDTLQALPQRAVPFALHYNQDLFDQFGVNYPTDNMMWAEVVSLAREMTREVDGVDYYGLLPRHEVLPRTFLNSRLLDPDTDEPLFSTDDFLNSWAQTWDTLYSIPGILPSDDSDLADSRGLWSSGVLAMHPTWEQLDQAVAIKEESGMNSDIVTFPQWEEYPGLMPESETHVVGIASTTEQEDWAFRVLEYLVGPDYHYDNPQFATSARLAFSDRDVLDNYETNPVFDGYHLEALHGLANAPGPEQRSAYEAEVREQLIAPMLHELAYEQKDVNTILREYDEHAAEIVRQIKEFE